MIKLTLRRNYLHNPTPLHKIWLLAVTLGVVMSACTPSELTKTTQPEKSEGIVDGKIVYVGADGNIHLTDIEGGSQTAITTDAKIPTQINEIDALYYQHPTWARDGRHLAYVQSTRSLTGGSQDVVIIYNLAMGESTQVYSSTDEFVIYPYWSPDNQNLSFLTTAAMGSNLLLQMTSLQGEVQLIDQGGPYYWSFAPSGKRALVHSGRDESGNPASLMKMLDLTGAKSESIPIDLDGAIFQAPTWSKNGDKMLAAIRLNDGRIEIVLLDDEANIINTVTGVNGAAAFGLSPDGSKMALIEKSLPSSPLFQGRLQVYDLNSGEEIFSSPNSRVFAFFWSPHSEKLIFYVYQLVPSGDFETASTTERMVNRIEIQSDDSIKINVEVYDLSSRNAKALMQQMTPSERMMQVKYFFDQYQQSDTFWSPDSRWILVMGTPIRGAGGVWVLDSTGKESARFLVEGVLAFWSWR